MEPQIRFCTTSDGVRIAYSVMGTGPLVIRVPPWISHVELDWQSPISRPLIERLAQHFTYVRFDKRGTGLSDREAPEVGVEAHVRDLQAVIDHLGAERFALTGQSEGGPACIVYAARHPERVTRMVLSGTFARELGAYQPEVRRAFITIVRNEWGMGSKMLTELFFGPDVPLEMQKWFTQYQRAGATAEVAARMIQANYDLDVSAMLPLIECPVLVIHGRRDHVIPFERGREIAAGIRDSEFFVHEGAHSNADPGFYLKLYQKIIEFLHAGEVPPPSAAPTEGQRDTAIILFVDIADSTALTERLGDARFRTASAALDERLREAIRAHGGTTIEGKVMGDGVMATFTSAAQGIAAAQRCIDISAESELRLHVGLHAGDVIRSSGNAYGGAVNIAARVCDASKPGEILVTEVVRGLARTSAGVAFEDRGEQSLKGIGDPVRLFAVSG